MNDEQRVKFEAFLIEHDSEIGHGRYHKYHPMYPDQYFDYNAHIAWLAWQAAQQVKPLEFVECNIQYRDRPAAYLKAETPLGNYTIHKYKYFGDQFATNYFYTGPGNGGKAVAAEATAIEAANEDYQRRVLSCLVHGGV